MRVPRARIYKKLLEADLGQPRGRGQEGRAKRGHIFAKKGAAKQPLFSRIYALKRPISWISNARTAFISGAGDLKIVLPPDLPHGKRFFFFFFEMFKRS